MAKFKFNGPIRYRLRSFLTINRIAISIYFNHLLGRKMAADWSAEIEIGVRFWRHQFTIAMNQEDMETGRRIYNSQQTLTDDVYGVKEDDLTNPRGTWFVPESRKTEKVLLYFHGGGYTFGGPNSKRFAAMLAHHTGARMFMPKYRRTPEHPHPAQAEDALSAWRYISEQHKPEELIIIGDSAGGHMALTLLQRLADMKATQPSLCIALCPWVDIGERGDSMTTNNHYDIVQGWMALRFGEWLDPENKYGRAELSPIYKNYSGLAPIYIQAGGREMFRDPIAEFAEVQAKNGADVMLDVWDDMPHNFQAYDSMFASSTEALMRLADIVASPNHRLPTVEDVTAVHSKNKKG